LERELTLRPIFHLLHCITDSLNSNCELYWKSVIKLLNAIYTYFVEDEALLLKALKDGSFSKTGKTLSDTEIRDLQHSTRYKQQYSKFLRELILPLVQRKDIASICGLKNSKMTKIKVATHSLYLEHKKSCDGAVEKGPHCFGCPRHGH
jgi:phage anti-repressor protein